MKHHSLQLYGYHVWANRQWFAQLKTLPEAIVHRKVQSVFPTIMEGIAHMYTVDHVWLYAMSGKSYEDIRAGMGQVIEETKDKGIEELEILFGALTDNYQTFFEQLPDLEAYISYHHPTFGTLEAPYSEIIQHIVNHGTYHRGNLSAMLRQLGHSGVSTDYVHYLYQLKEQKQ